MKNIIVLITFMCLCLGCKKDSHMDSDNRVEIFEPGSQENGYATAKKLGEDWEASANIELAWRDCDQYLFISFTTYNDSDELRESLTLLGFQKLAGAYEIVDTIEKNTINSQLKVKGFYSRLTADGDAVIATYKADLSKGNRFTITTIDSTSISGTFRLHLDQDISAPNSLPKNISFLEGKFTANLDF